MWSGWRTATAGCRVAAVYLGLGTNLGDREENLRHALARLAEVVEIEAVSAVYASEPVGYTEQPEFWNMAVRARTELAPRELLRRTRAIERAMGRVPTFRNGPRLIDIDLLLYGREHVGEVELEVPHPRMLERAFVLRPLLDLDPALTHPITGVALAERAAVPGLGRVERLFAGDRLLPKGDDADL